jgi:hypothetical protein
MLIKRHKNDLLLILAVLLLTGGVWLYTRLTREAGGEAVVTVDGKEVAVLPLDTDTALTVAAQDGSGCSNTVTVADGRVCVSAANCPDRLCVGQGWKRYEAR